MATSPGASAVALVTGAASGMGRLSALRLAAAGTSVVALDVDRVGLDRTARRAPQVRTEVCDVRDLDAVRNLVSDVESSAGPITRVVNAAAIARSGPLPTQDPEEVASVAAVNYFGLVNVTMACLPAMLERKAGLVVQFGSLAGWLPSPYFGAYSASKAAVVSFSETLSHELSGTGVQVVCACPPMVDTPMLEEFRLNGPPGFERLPAISPEEVLDSIEDAVERGRLFAFPGRGTKALQVMRRLAPEQLWKRIDGATRG